MGHSFRTLSTVRARLFWLVPSFVLLLLAGGCVNEAQEQEIGEAIASDINQQIPLVEDPLLTAYIDRLGTLLARASDRPELDYNFFIINSDVVNAFALPGGYIYLTRGLLEQTRSGPELAAVLAHEIGHVAARHGVQKLERQLRTGSVVGMLYNVILGGQPNLLRQRALGLGGTLWSARHSREDEKEADELAVEYLVRTGVNPAGMISLLQTLLEDEAEQDSSRVSAWFSTHPVTSQRISQAQAEIETIQAEAAPENPLTLSSYPAFLRRLEALPPPPVP